MRVTLSKEEVCKIVSDHVRTTMQSGCDWDMSSGSISYDGLTFAEMTQDYIEAKAKEEAAREEYLAKYRAEQKAKEAAAEAVTVAQSSSF